VKISVDTCGTDTKALQKAEYSDFCIFAKFETRNIPYTPYILKKSRQNQTFILQNTHKNFEKI
jgi:hypothetical protein